MSKSRGGGDAITPQQWYGYFKELNCKDKMLLSSFDTTIYNYSNSNICNNCLDISFCSEMLSCDITDEEVLMCINELKWNKAAGEGGIPPDFFGCFPSTLFERPILTRHYISPTVWNIGMVVPLFKSGTLSEQSNYRNISLIDISGKLFTSILENRLKKFRVLNISVGE